MADSRRKKSYRKGELHSYLYSGGFHRLEGKSTAPGSLARTESSRFRTVCLAVIELAFLAVGCWYMFR